MTAPVFDDVTQMLADLMKNDIPAKGQGPIPGVSWNPVVAATNPEFGGAGSGPHEGSPHPHGGAGSGAAPLVPGAAGPAPGETVVTNITPAAAQAFHDQFENVFKGNPYTDFVTHYTPEQIQGMKAIMTTNDGKTGCLVHDHGDGRVEVTALYNVSDVPNAGIEQMRNSIKEQGVNYAECFGDVLQEKYTGLGFKMGDTYKFDPKEAPANWNYEAHDNPDYHIMNLAAALAQRNRMTYSGTTQQGGAVYRTPSMDIDWNDPAAVLAWAQADMASAEAATDPDVWAATGKNLWMSSLVLLGIPVPDELA